MREQWGSDSSEEQIVVERATAGDEQALTQLWESNRRWVAAVLYAHRPRGVDLDDLMQEVAVKLVAKVHTVRDPGAFRAWLRRTAINVAREAARGRKGNVSLTDPTLIEDEAGPAVRTGGSRHCQESDVRDEARGLLDHAMSLPPDFREPLILRCVRGLGCQQIAEILDLPVTTIETRLSRSRRMLREEWLKRTAAESDATSQASAASRVRADAPVTSIDMLGKGSGTRT
ncbi:MAG: RNA polymerase sigma factor [Planctomycetes bacterium]|nr:RNA polymerase sigma factor [Planctomycetota bacterium]NOG53855.1 RNA polymerase sigma factor [Planctomycetota bacterium]